MTDEELKKMADAYEEEQRLLNRKRSQLQTIQSVKKFISSVRSGQNLREIKTMQIAAYNRSRLTVAAVQISDIQMECIVSVIENNILPQLESEHDRM